MKTLNLLVTLLTLTPAFAHAVPEGTDEGEVWQAITYATRGRHNRSMLWFRRDATPSGGAVPLYERPCPDEAGCADFVSEHTLTTVTEAGASRFFVNVAGDTQDQRLGALSRTTVADVARADAMTAAAPAAASADTVTDADAAAITDDLASVDTTFGEAGTLDAPDASGATGDESTVVDAAAALATGDEEPTAAPAPGVSDLRTEMPPAPQPRETRRGLALPGRVAAGVGLGWLGMIVALAASATPLGVAGAALVMGGAGFGLASFFGRHEV
ncbi:MAG: hypothetical protein SF051_14240 [Elusimicrobiota bacterium]|nr:hypothetical protein [Elusimicrobiota bacterium]